MKNIPFLNRVRQSLTLMALLLAGQLTTVAAATNITADDIKMGIGDTYTVEVKLTADEDVINPQFDIVLPDGIEFVEDSQAKGSLLTRSHSLNVAKQTGNVYRFLVTSTTNAALNGTEGTLLTFQIKANKKLSGEMGITNKYMQSATYNKEQTPPRTEYSPADTEVSITADVAMDGDATVSVSAEAIPVTVGEPFRLGFILENTATIVSLQADLVLPEGVELVKTADGNIGYTDRIPDGVTIDATENGGVYKIVMSSLTNTPIEGSEGTLFTIDMMAGETFVAGSTLTLSNIVVASANGAGKMFDGVEFSVVLTKGFTPGDVNGDGEVTAQDASLVLQLVAGKKTAESEGVVYDAADVNGDGEVTAQDASLILQLVAGKITEF